jgi:hypothetical protein
MGSPLGGDWKRLHPDTRTTVLTNWLLKVMGPNYTADYIGEDDHVDRENYPQYMTRNDQPDNRR